MCLWFTWCIFIIRLKDAHVKIVINIIKAGRVYWKFSSYSLLLLNINHQSASVSAIELENVWKRNCPRGGISQYLSYWWNLQKVSRSQLRFYQKLCVNIFKRLNPKYKRSDCKSLVKLHDIYFEFLVFFKSINELQMAKYLCTLQFESLSEVIVK